jgi:hypothetical protein
MKIILFLIAFNLIACSVYSQTSVSGGIYQNTSWTLAGSPYLVTGSIVVFPGNELTIEPGCEIIIQNQTNSGIYIEARGGISMIGTPSNPIKIKTLIDTTNIGWIGFKCTSSLGGTISANYFQISNAIKPFDFEGNNNAINYSDCIFSHNEQAIRVDSSVNLTNCIFRDNVLAVFGWSSFSITNCSFIENGTGINAYVTNFQMVNSSFDTNVMGVTFSSMAFNPMNIENCSFSNNETGMSSVNNGDIHNCSFSTNNIGIDFGYNCSIYDNIFNGNITGLSVSFESVVTNNIISSNLTGISFINLSSGSTQPIITNNEICSNSLYNVDNQTNLNLSLQTNCFCGIDSTTIEQFLFDGYDDITKGLINYTMYDSTCTSVLETVLKFQDQSAGLFSNIPSISPYTNPVKDYLTIFQETAIEQLRIYTTNGQIFTAEATSPNVFDLQFLSPGIYFIQGIQKNAITSVLKIIKQ